MSHSPQSTPSNLSGSWGSEYTTASFKRLHRSPRTVFKGATLASLTPRGAWLLKQSEQRYIRREDAYGLRGPLVGEIGRVEQFRFIVGSRA